MLSGGNCGPGALAAGLSEAAVQANWVDPPPKAFASWGTFKGAIEAGMVGGAASSVAGGKFQDGFSVAAAGYLFNAAQHSEKTEDIKRYEQKVFVSFGYVPVADGYHLFIEVETTDGTQTWFFRAGPSAEGNPLSAVAANALASGGASGNGGMGNITVSYGLDAAAADLMRAAHWQFLGAADISFSQAVSRIETFGAAVDLANIRYLPLTQNSNSFAMQVPSILGMPTPRPVWTAHGSDTVLLPGY
jgi:hypothetical protein